MLIAPRKRRHTGRRRRTNQLSKSLLGKDLVPEGESSRGKTKGTRFRLASDSVGRSGGLRHVQELSIAVGSVKKGRLGRHGIVDTRRRPGSGADDGRGHPVSQRELSKRTICLSWEGGNLFRRDHLHELLFRGKSISDSWNSFDDS